MKIHVVYDKQGTIISAGVSQTQPYDFRGPRFGPKAAEGHSSAELEVPEGDTNVGFAELIKRHRVDVKSKEHRLVSRSE